MSSLRSIALHGTPYLDPPDGTTPDLACNNIFCICRSFYPQSQPSMYSFSHYWRPHVWTTVSSHVRLPSENVCTCGCPYYKGVCTNRLLPTQRHGVAHRYGCIPNFGLGYEWQMEYLHYPCICQTSSSLDKLLPQTSHPTALSAHQITTYSFLTRFVVALQKIPSHVQGSVPFTQLAVTLSGSSRLFLPARRAARIIIHKQCRLSASTDKGKLFVCHYRVCMQSCLLQADAIVCCLQKLYGTRNTDCEAPALTFCLGLGSCGRQYER